VRGGLPRSIFATCCVIVEPPSAAQMNDVMRRRGDGDRVDASVMIETAILGGDGGVADGGRNLIEPFVARAGRRQRLVENDAVRSTIVGVVSG
jgi:hypothetical protein